jgi:hypothetical protein
MTPFWAMWWYIPNFGFRHIYPNNLFIKQKRKGWKGRYDDRDDEKSDERENEDAHDWWIWTQL